MHILRSDALVIGGGLEGALLALSLHRTGHTVTLLDRGRPQNPDRPYDRWICSPFLHPEWAWRWIQASQTDWQVWDVWRETSGCALAAYESNSYAQLREQVEVYSLRSRPLATDDFPELKRETLASFCLDALPWLETDGIMLQLWQTLERKGVRVEADSPVRLIDWEHDQPTAVTRDTIFRARRLFLCAGRSTEKLLGLPLPKLERRQLWLESAPELEPGRPRPRPNLWVHYAKAPLHILTDTPRWGCVRLQDYAEEGAEIRFLREARERWLRCSFRETQVHELMVPGWEDGLPVIDHHPWRDDCWWLAGVGQTHWPWLPRLLQQLADPQAAAVPEVLRLSRTIAAAADG